VSHARQAEGGGAGSTREPVRRSARRGRGPREGRPWTGALLCLPLALFLAAAFVAPLTGLLPQSLERTPGMLGLGAPADAVSPGGPTLANYRRAFSSRGDLAAFRNSLVLSAAVAVASIVLCLPPAWLLARQHLPGRSLLRTVLALPLTFSGVIVGFLAILVLGRLGLLPAVLRVLTGEPLLSGSAYTLGGLVAAYVYFEVPRATLTLEAAFQRLDREQQVAAATLGAGPVRRLFRITLPQVWPALLSTLAVTFAASMGSFGVALILAKRLELVPLSIYTEYTGFLDQGYAAALCLLLAGATLAAAAVLRALTRDGDWIYG